MLAVLWGLSFSLAAAAVPELVRDGFVSGRGRWPQINVGVRPHGRRSRGWGMPPRVGYLLTDLRAGGFFVCAAGKVVLLVLIN